MKRKVLKLFFLHKNKRAMISVAAMVLLLICAFIIFQTLSCKKNPTDAIKELKALESGSQKPQLNVIKRNDSLYSIVEKQVPFDSKIDVKLPANPQQETPVIQQPEPVAETPAPMPEEILDEQIYLVVETPPQFPGGENARAKFLKENVIYPPKALEKNLQGEVYVSFVVEPNGELSNINLLGDMDSNFAQEALRVVKNMPRWNPGEQRGHPVRVQINMPIKFSFLK